MSMTHDVTKTIRTFCLLNMIDDDIAFGLYDEILDNLEWELNYDAKTDEEKVEFRRKLFFSYNDKERGKRNCFERD